MTAHTFRIKKGLAIAASTVPDSGLGVFATKPYKKGDLVVHYNGHILKNAKMEVRIA